MMLSLRARAALLFAIAATATTAVACGGATVREPSETEQQQEPGSSSGTPGRAPNASGNGDDSSPPSPGKELPPEPACCPADAVVSGSMNLGGAAAGAPCPRMHDFFCATNWRLANDAYGCPQWTYDVRKPTPNENTFCQPLPACAPGSYVFCRCDDGAEGTKLCKADGTFEACGPCD